jgi:hypothetical protein
MKKDGADDFDEIDLEDIEPIETDRDTDKDTDEDSEGGKKSSPGDGGDNTRDRDSQGSDDVAKDFVKVETPTAGKDKEPMSSSGMKVRSVLKGAGAFLSSPGKKDKKMDNVAFERINEPETQEVPRKSP